MFISISNCCVNFDLIDQLLRSQYCKRQKCIDLTRCCLLIFQWIWVGFDLSVKNKIAFREKACSCLIKATIEYLIRYKKLQTKSKQYKEIEQTEIYFLQQFIVVIFLSATQLRYMRGVGVTFFGGWLKGCSVLWWRWLKISFQFLSELKKFE